MEQEPQFEDPAFRAALRRTCASETAPPGLRERIAKQMSSVEVAAPVRRKLWIGPQTIKLLAACLAIVVLGLGFYELRQWGFLGGSGSETYVFGRLPKKFANAMAEVHDKNSSLPGYKVLAETDSSQLQQKLSRDVQIPVVVVDLGNGWTLKSAGECKIGEETAAHLMYSKGNQTVSVFSIPARAVFNANVPDGSSYEQKTSNDEHQLSGFTKGKGLYCVVADGAAKMDELTAMRGKVQVALSQP